MAKFKTLIDKVPNAEEHMENLSMMKEYSFCKSHAISYSYLVWALAYWKVRDPKKFWHATLQHCHSMYAKWVHVMEAKRSGLRFATVGSNWLREGDVLYDVKQTPFLFHDGYAEYKKHGYWLSNRFMPGCTEVRLGNKIRIRGLIATYRGYRAKDKRLTFITVGSGPGIYWDLVVEGDMRLHNQDLLDVEGEMKLFFNHYYVCVTKVNGYKSIDRDWNISQEKEHMRRISMHM